VALVGPSGSGKSTLVNLTLRFFDPDRGAVVIDGQDIKQVTIESLRDAIALVTQDPVLFDDTIRANIAYGTKPVEESKVIGAAKAAAAHDFIMALPRGYDTRVGEAGGLLSGGERQRIAIARALYKDAPILLLDEPTSSLDSEAEAKVQAALEELMRGRTVLMIAHRLSTVKKADARPGTHRRDRASRGARRQRRPLHAASSHAIRHFRWICAGAPRRRGSRQRRRRHPRRARARGEQVTRRRYVMLKRPPALHACPGHCDDHAATTGQTKKRALPPRGHSPGRRSPLMLWQEPVTP
jgi:ABC-type lipoprotein export system ATPase subunit